MLYVALLFAHTLCCRITEVLRLRGKDVEVERRSVRVASMKRAPEVDKRISKALLPKIQKLQKAGVPRRRNRRQGARGNVSYMACA